MNLKVKLKEILIFNLKMEYILCKVCGEAIDIIDKFENQKIYHCENCSNKLTISN